MLKRKANGQFKKQKQCRVPVQNRVKAKSIINRDMTDITKAYIKAFEAEENYLSELEEKEVRKEEEKLRIAAQIDYNREAYFEANVLGQVERLKAYLVTFKNHPHLSYLSFALTADKARAEAQKYMRDTFYMGYSIDSCPISLKETRTKRMKDLDKFKHTGKVPIPDLLKTGFRMQCSSCGRFEFDYDDYMARKCFVVEGEGDLTPFTNGYIFCYDCYKKYF